MNTNFNLSQKLDAVQFGVDLQPIDCLGFLPGSHCPHYDGEAKRRPAYHELISNGMAPGWAADDGVGLHFINGQLRRVVSSRLGADGYWVELKDGAVVEKKMGSTFLGDTAGQQGARADALTRAAQL